MLTPSVACATLTDCRDEKRIQVHLVYRSSFLEISWYHVGMAGHV